MQNRFSNVVTYNLFVLSIIFLIFLGWVNYQLASRHPGGDQFLVYWTGTRALLNQGNGPYQKAVTDQIQKTASGWDAPTQSKQLQFLSPLFAELVYLPFAFISDYTLARAIWMTALEVILFLILLVSKRVAQWQTKPGIFLAYLLFGLFWFHSIYPLIQGSDIILIALAVPFVFSAVQAGQDELAGILLAFMMIEPLTVILLVLFSMMWAWSQRRWKIVVWFLGTLFILTILAVFIYPNWPIEYLRAIISHLKSSLFITPGTIFAHYWPGLGSRLGWIITIILGIFILIEWWVAGHINNNRGYIWAACLTIAASPLMGIGTNLSNYIILIAPMALVFSTWEGRWNTSGRIWIVITMILFGVIPWLLNLDFLNKGSTGVDMFSFMVFPLPLFLIVALYWIRWWAMRPSRLYVESLRDLEKA